MEGELKLYLPSLTKYTAVADKIKSLEVRIRNMVESLQAGIKRTTA